MANEPTRSRHGIFRRMVEGIFLGYLHPPVLAPYRRDLPGDHDLAGRSGSAAVLYEADRIGRRAGYAMENVAYWVNVAGSIIAEVASAGNAVIGAGRAARPAATAIKVVESE